MPEQTTPPEDSPGRILVTSDMLDTAYRAYKGDEWQKGTVPCEASRLRRAVQAVLDMLPGDRSC